jgi:ubiquinone/menaquinone biosynthesis C-methylase UbiE
LKATFTTNVTHAASKSGLVPCSIFSQYTVANLPFWNTVTTMLTRKLEPEVMDSERDATEYNSMDHSEVNRVFVTDLLDCAERVWLSNGQIGAAAFSDDEDDQRESPFHLGDVLDVGTGTALIPVELCKRYRDGRVMAIDMAVSMLNLAVYNVEAAGLRNRIQLAQVDAKQMIFLDSMFDVVMSNSIIHHLSDPIETVREMVRVARPAGLFFVRDLMRPESQEQLSQLVQRYTGNESEYAQQLFGDSLRAALSLAEMRELVASLGFPADSVQATSDRHWTWAARKENG